MSVLYTGHQLSLPNLTPGKGQKKRRQRRWIPGDNKFFLTTKCSCLFSSVLKQTHGYIDIMVSDNLETLDVDLSQLTSTQVSLQDLVTS